MLTQKKHIHFIGIGGIGMSALAGVAHGLGHTVSGCDTNLKQKSIDHLRLLKCSITQQNQTSIKNINPDIIVYSSAISSKSTIILEAEKYNITKLHRAEFLAEITKLYKTIAVTGAHGKTTTSSMIAHILIESNKKPTAILGGFLQSIGSNYHLGSDELLVIEADESDKSMLKLWPTSAIITNIDREHLDTYNNERDMQAAFLEFINRLPQNGHAIIFSDIPLGEELVKRARKNNSIKITTYGRSNNADVQIMEESFDPNNSYFLLKETKNNTSVTLTLPFSGKHMVENATAAYISASSHNISFKKIAKALASFPGTEQRFTDRGSFQGAQIIDDYAHHPTEIAHTITSAMRRKPNRLIVVFQPQRYSRTESLWNDFVQVLSQAPITKLIITDIYSASEAPKAGITGEKLAQAVNISAKEVRALYIPQKNSYQDVRKKLEEIVKKDDIVLFLGAGKVNQLSQELTKK